MRQLNVFINERQVGVLFEGDDIWAFKYNKQWLEYDGSYPICPQIPLQDEKQIDGSTKRYIQWFFDNLLPEEGARTLLAQAINADEADSFGILAVTGAESAGAISLINQYTDMIDNSVQVLSSEEINSRIKQLPNIPLNNKESKRMSIAGAQHKMLVIKEGDIFLEPSGSMPSSHILKPEHSMPDQYWQTVRNEWFVMNLAHELGLNVPPTEVCYFPCAAYVIKRFDREGNYPNQSRIHALDGCQLLGLSRSAKYTQSNAQQLTNFSEQMRGQGAVKIAILNWAIFNAFVGNTDAHLKNLTCLVTSNGLVLAPLYDLISTAIYKDSNRHLSAELSQKMGNAIQLGDLTRDDILLFGEELGLNRTITIRQLDKILNNIETKADKIIDHVNNLQNIPGKAGELRMLREIRYKMIAEMVLRLSK